MLGMSINTLAGRVRLTFQQVNKYERGENRMAASVLWRVAGALDVTVGYFFEGLGRAVEPCDDVDRFVLRLTQKLRRLDPEVREKISDLVSALDIR